MPECEYVISDNADMISFGHQEYNIHLKCHEEARVELTIIGTTVRTIPARYCWEHARKFLDEWEKEFTGV